MPTYWIDPMAPLVFRSGKPFGTGSRDGANFPWPSAFAGLMRTHAAENDHSLPDYDIAALRQLTVAGPFLGKRSGNTFEVYLPKPYDAAYLLPDTGGVTGIFRLAPGVFPPGSGADLPEGLQPIVIEPGAPKGKPQKGPAFWPLSRMIAWRCNRTVSFEELDDVDLPVAVRTHVAIERGSLAADPGRLFQTEGWAMGWRRMAGGGGFASHRWGLMGRFERDISPRAVCFGGERRLSWLEPIESDPLAFSEADREAIEAAVDEAKHLALTFVTPAAFVEGWRPGWANGNQDVPGIPGLRLKLKAAALERWLGHSGWDLALKRPRAARALVPAGTTYWFEILQMPKGGIESLWFASVSDDPQDRRDGFGLVVPGV